MMSTTLSRSVSPTGAERDPRNLSTYAVPGACQATPICYKWVVTITVTPMLSALLTDDIRLEDETEEEEAEPKETEAEEEEEDPM